jgi:hypothetical protein
MITLLFLILALICFVIATFNLASPVNMTALGLVFVVLSMMAPALSTRL